MSTTFLLLYQDHDLTLYEHDMTLCQYDLTLYQYDRRFKIYRNRNFLTSFVFVKIISIDLEIFRRDITIFKYLLTNFSL